MKGIRIYCEGGGDGRASREMLTKGFREFLKELVTSARAHKIHFDVFACGSRRDAYEKFKTSLQTYQDSFNILLVDAEEPVTQSSWNHLKKRDSWDVLNSSEEQCHLMVQTMEAWLIADPKALKKFYGQGFSINALPKNPNVEQIEKDRLVSSLNNAIRQTNKPEYHKIKHASELLKIIDPNKVRQASKHCDRIFTTIISLMG